MLINGVGIIVMTIAAPPVSMISYVPSPPACSQNFFHRAPSYANVDALEPRGASARFAIALAHAPLRSLIVPGFRLWSRLWFVDPGTVDNTTAHENPRLNPRRVLAASRKASSPRASCPTVLKSRTSARSGLQASLDHGWNTPRTLLLGYKQSGHVRKERFNYYTLWIPAQGSDGEPWEDVVITLTSKEGQAQVGARS